jgi:hypothetical protein
MFHFEIRLAAGESLRDHEKPGLGAASGNNIHYRKLIHPAFQAPPYAIALSWTFTPGVFRGLRSAMAGAVKVVTHDERCHDRRGAIYRRRLPGPLEIAEPSVTAGFLMIAKDFIPEMGTNPSRS